MLTLDRIASFAQRAAVLQQPERLTQRPEYEKRPDWTWISSILAELRSLHQLAQDQACGAERASLDQVVRRITSDLKSNEQWLEEQLNRELAALTQNYGSRSWAEALRELPGETWFVLSQRDRIEAILRVPALLGLNIEFPEAVRSQIALGDSILRTTPEIQIEYAHWPAAEREREHSREDWWWWLDTPDPTAVTS